MRYIVGVDEAGRGSLAGPVAVGAVAVPEHIDLLASFPGLNDSKQLSAVKRERIFLEATGYLGIMCHVEWGSVEEIDGRGITRAVAEATARAVSTVLTHPQDGRVFLDGLLHAPREYEQETIIRGDATVPAIMLASVIAKVTRDRLMVALSDEYPGYDLHRHKGYGTEAHRRAIHTYGTTSIHRKTFTVK